MFFSEIPDTVSDRSDPKIETLEDKIRHLSGIIQSQDNATKELMGRAINAVLETNFPVAEMAPGNEAFKKALDEKYKTPFDKVDRLIEDLNPLSDARKIVVDKTHPNGEPSKANDKTKELITEEINSVLGTNFSFAEMIVGNKDFERALDEKYEVPSEVQSPIFYKLDKLAKDLEYLSKPHGILFNRYPKLCQNSDRAFGYKFYDREVVIDDEGNRHEGELKNGSELTFFNAQVLSYEDVEKIFGNIHPRTIKMREYELPYVIKAANERHYFLDKDLKYSGEQVRVLDKTGKLIFPDEKNFPKPEKQIEM